MKLFSLIEAAAGYPLHSYGYENFHTDKRPKVLYLGKWRHPKTKNMLIGGINLNKLNPKELAIIQNKLPEIYPSSFKSSLFSIAGMKGIGSLKDNYDRLKRVAPWIITSRRYQTWDKKYIHSITTDTLKYIDPNEIEDKADAIDKKEPAYADAESREKDLRGDAATKRMLSKSSAPKEPAAEPADLELPPKEGQQSSNTEPEQAPEQAPEQKPEKEQQPQEPELPQVPPPPSSGGFKVSASARDAAEINNTKEVPTAGGMVKKPDTLTGNAVAPSGNAAPGANAALASRIKKK